MLKIATVMLTTALFAGLLIVEPYGQEMGRPSLGQTQTTPGTQSPTPVVQQADHTAGEAEQSPAPAPTQSAVEQLKKELVSVAPNRVRTTGNRRTTRTRTAGLILTHRTIA